MKNITLVGEITRMPQNLKMSSLIAPSGEQIFYQGSDLALGPQPALIYFALSGEESIFQDPFNQPAVKLAKEKMRVFSWNLPFHKPGIDPINSLLEWGNAFIEGAHFIEEFIDLSVQNIDFLTQEGLIDPTKLAVAGLSRGAYMATQLAARDNRINIIAGFSPYTQPRVPQEMAHESPVSVESLALNALVESLINKKLRFYIGNHDARVSTEACFNFIKNLADANYLNKVRTPPVEMIIYPSIGHKGHGTPSYIFDEGANWIRTQLFQ
jgi:dienelactone hydrolase